MELTNSTPQKLDIKTLTDQDVLTSKFKDPVEFSQYIEKVAWERDITLIEALLWYAEEEDIEDEAIARLITKTLKEKIQFQAEEACLIPKTTSRLMF